MMDTPGALYIYAQPACPCGQPNDGGVGDERLCRDCLVKWLEDHGCADLAEKWRERWKRQPKKVGT